MKNGPSEFKADAVALYESRPEATVRSVASGLGINPQTLRNWQGQARRRVSIVATTSQLVAVGWRRGVEERSSRPSSPSWR
ncbi:transposase [Streptomyces sp. NPDC054995]